ncbi:MULTISPECIES: hypothetical protein [unclassified Phyllobacterium]|uniref:hypothetical protein n=1 Tax=unclassified Phyllobacterium TaxID=2638441 RepID=UPI0031FD3F9B|nr:hypothetical protein [Phyllobacterium sp.]
MAVADNMAATKIACFFELEFIMLAQMVQSRPQRMQATNGDSQPVSPHPIYNLLTITRPFDLYSRAPLEHPDDGYRLI